LTIVHSRLRLLTLAGAGLAALITGFGPVQAQVDNPNNPILKNFGPRIHKPQQAQQPKQPNQPKPQVMGTFGDWKVACQDATAAVVKQGGAKRACGMSITVQDDKSKQLGLTVMLRKQKKADKTTMSTIQVITPVGVYLPVGIAVEIDGNAAGRLPYARCLPQFCLAFSEIRPTTLEKLQKGSSANFIIYEAPGVSVPLAVSLKGFTAAYDSLDKYD